MNRLDARFLFGLELSQLGRGLYQDALQSLHLVQIVIQKLLALTLHLRSALPLLIIAQYLDRLLQKHPRIEFRHHTLQPLSHIRLVAHALLLDQHLAYQFYLPQQQ